MNTDSPKKGYALTELFTEAQLQRAVEIINNHDTRDGRLNVILIEKVVREAMPQINKVTGQENNESYFAYALEYGLGRAGLLKNVDR